MSPNRKPSPEQRELEKKMLQLEALQKQLVERELELETLRGGLLSFEKKYQTATLERYTMLDELRFRIAELQAKKQPDAPHAKVAATMASIAAGMSMSPSAAAAKRRTAPRKPPPRKGESKKDAPGAGNASGFNPSEAMKKLYREVAKTIHPDLADDEEERAHRHAFMTRANEAYEANNQAKLAEILHEWHCSPEAIRGRDPGSQLIRTIRTIARCEDRMTQIETDMGKLETAGIFGIKLLAEEADKLERDFLSEMTSRLDEEIEGAKAILLSLGGTVPDSSELQAPDDSMVDEAPPPPGESAGTGSSDRGV